MNDDRIVPMWDSSPSNVRHITNYSSFTSSLKHLLFEMKCKSVLSVVVVVHDFLNVCAVIAAYHNHIIKCWWKLKYTLGGNY